MLMGINTIISYGVFLSVYRTFFNILYRVELETHEEVYLISREYGDVCQITITHCRQSAG